MDLLCRKKALDAWNKTRVTVLFERNPQRYNYAGFALTP
jgi:hypothetical protein